MRLPPTLRSLTLTSVLSHRTTGRYVVLSSATPKFRKAKLHISPERYMKWRHRRGEKNEYYTKTNLGSCWEIG